MTALNSLPSHYIGQVFAHKLSFISDVLAKKGFSLAHLLKGTNIEPSELSNSEYRIQREQIITFYRNIVALQVPDIAISLGGAIKPNDYGLYGCTLLCCKDLKSALEFSIRYHSLATKTVRKSLHIDEQKGFSYFRFEDLLHAPDIIEFNIELQSAIVLSLTRECLGDKHFSFDELRLSFERPKHYKLYQAYFQCPITYGNPYNEFVMSNDKIALKTPRSNPFAMPLLLEQCDTVLNSIATKNEFLIGINQWVSANMHRDISSEELANYLCMAPRTLRRKLADQGTSFRDIVKELRCDAAKKLLVETHLTIEDVAESIGFNDASNFRAAFKKWTGKTPASLR